MIRTFFVILVACLAARAQTLTVGPQEKLTSIKEAITLATPGDTIIVKPGHYTEQNIIISKPIILTGNGKPVLDGENKYEVITVRATGVVIAGFRIINSGISSIEDIAGIGGDRSHHLTISNINFENTFFGVHISDSRHCTIENNTFVAPARQEHQSGNGVHLWKCDDMVIKNNHITKHRDGIYFEFVTNSRILNNVSEKNLRYGLHFMFSHDNTYTDNVFRNNGAGVAVMYSEKVRMKNNDFSENWGSSSYGLLLKDIRDSHIENNRFIKNTSGIYMEGTSRSVFNGNIFRENGWAIKLQASCDLNTFTANNFTANTFDIATNGSMVLNTLDKNYWDKYEGYDLNKDGLGDVPFRPVSMYSMVVERIPAAMLLWRSFLVFLLDRSEKVMPAITPENLKDNTPAMRPYDHS